MEAKEQNRHANVVGFVFGLVVIAIFAWYQAFGGRETVSNLFSGVAGNIASVQNGVLKFDKSTTVGQVFDSYKYISDKGTWKEVSDGRGRTFVTWTAPVKGSSKECVVWTNVTASKADQMPCSVSGEIVVTFLVMQDDEFQVDSASWNFTYALSDGRKVVSRDKDNGASMIEAIYRNEPAASYTVVAPKT